MLLELFTLTGYDTRPLAVLLGLTGLPLGLDIVGAATPLLVDMTYEPLGVAVFALGVVSLLSARFRAVRLSSDVDDPAVFVGDGGVVRDANAPAVELFPALSDAVGDRLADRVPTLAAGWMADERVLELDRDGEPRYYRLSTSTLASGDDRFGRMLLIVDITDKERYRREAERQNERLGQLAAVISHDLRNPLNVARGHLELERERRDTESLAAAGTALERMERLIEDLLALTQAGLDIGDCRPVSLAALARAGWSTVDTEDAELVVADDYALLADDDRLRQVFENLFRNSVEHGAVDDRSEGGDGFDPGATATDGGPGRASGGPAVTVGLLPEDAGFFIADDGPGIPADEREAALEFGHSGADGSGLGLAIVDTIVEAHGWTLRITDAEGGGARFEFAGVDPVDPEQVPTAESGGPTGDPWDEAGGGTAWSPDD
jgi:signal transduction histidine kinase